MDEKSQGKKNIRVGNISHSTGVGIGNDVRVQVNQGNIAQTDEIQKAFKAIEAKIEALPDGPQKVIAGQAVQGLAREAQKGEAAEEKPVRDWFNFLAQTAPDAFDVAVSTFINPIAGLGKVFQLVAKKAKEEKDKKAAEVKK
jgi:hypothetical protein